jgi:Tol biopolymer transport system component
MRERQMPLGQVLVLLLVVGLLLIIIGEIPRPSHLMFAFVVDRYDSNEIYIYDFFKGSTRQITHKVTTRPYRDLAWSPDKKQIAFATGSRVFSDIYVMNPDGSGRQRLTNDERVERWIVWSPNSQYLAFLSYDEKGEEKQIYVMERSGLIIRHFLAQGDLDWGQPFSWSPDSKQIVFASQRNLNLELYAVDIASGQERQLTLTQAREHNPRWSPDGENILFVSDSYLYGREIYKMSSDGRNIQSIFSSKTIWAYSPMWSPDGQRIAFIGDHDHSLYIMDSDGKHVRQLITTDDFITNFEWSPDNTFILFGSAAGRTSYSVINLDGSDLRKLTNTDNAHSATWGYWMFDS